MAHTKKIFAAMSGGVDSSVMAHLLLRDGYDVEGATMTLYRPPVAGGAAPLPCGSDEDVRDARAVCDSLGIAHRVYDFGQVFSDAVIEDFVRVYEAGGTPNPCIVCNKYLKFGALLEAALQDGADGIATGHYARVEKCGDRYLLRVAADENKDQTYVLWQLTQDVLSRVLLPLGGLRKSEIREMAADLNLCTAHKSDSQDICFVPDGDYASFIERHTRRIAIPGDFVTEDGTLLGQHRGVIHYTVGQRKGLGIALGQPMFVKSKDPVSRQVVLTTNDRLFFREIHLTDINLIATDRLDTPIRVTAKLRYRHKAAPATVVQTGDHTAILTFDEPQRAPAAGQSAVFYDGDIVVGGGLILTADP